MMLRLSICASLFSPPDALDESPFFVESWVLEEEEEEEEEDADEERALGRL